MKKVSAIKKKRVRVLLAACMLSGAFSVPGMAAEIITEPVMVQNKNTVISDDIHVTNGRNPTAIYIPKAAFGGDIYINSKNVEVDYSGNTRTNSCGLIDFDYGYTGNVYLADGIKLADTVTGPDIDVAGIRIRDVGNLIDRNTGKPVGGTVSIGNHVTLGLENQNTNLDDKNPAVFNSLRGFHVDGETLKAGDNLSVGLKTNTGDQSQTDAITVGHYGDVSIGNDARLLVENHTSGDMRGNRTSVISSSLQYIGEKEVVPNGWNRIRIGRNAQILMTFKADHILSEEELLRQENDSSSAQIAHGIYVQNTILDAGDSVVIDVNGSGSARILEGMRISNNSRVTIGDNVSSRLSMSGPVRELIVYNIRASKSAPSFLKIGKNSRTELYAEGPLYTHQVLAGIASDYGTIQVCDGANLSMKAENTEEYIGNSNLCGIRSEKNSHIEISNDMRMNIDTVGYNRTRGLYAYNAPNLSEGDDLKVGDNLSIRVSASGNGKSSGPDVRGLFNGNSGVSIGSHAGVTVEGSSDAVKTIGLYTAGNGTTDIGDDASIMVNSDAVKNNHVLHTESGGAITFAGSAYIRGNREAAWSEGEGSLISLAGTGKKTVLGDLVSSKKGKILLNLSTSDSLLRGTSSVLEEGYNEDVSAADTEISLSNNAKWQMTDTSYVTKLANNAGTVDMQYNPDYQDLHIGTFSGNDGVFKMKSDLASQTDGDKVTIDNADPGSTGIISVYDKSLATGKEVTGARHLLMVTDASKNAAFRGESVSTGGLWEITPSIREGSTFEDGHGNRVGNPGEWYLASVTKTINKDTKPLIDAGDNTYGFYRMSIDTLRQRLGDLRYRNRSDDRYDFWVRNRHGHFDSSGYDSKYNFFQVGVDTMPNEKSAYGFLVERGIASPRFDTGSGKNHTLAGALYATWIGDHGNYTDIVAKIGRNDTTLHTYGAYADKASYREDEKSLSFEYGRTLGIGEDGYFFEPQAQIVFGHLGSNSYTTRRGTHVHEDSFDSAIGRLGFVLGKKQKNGENPHDFYLKASILHEFGGDRDYSLRRVNAYGDEETLDGSYNYRDTWYEVGFGGNVKINNNTSFYADVERSFGSDYTKKWQINAGINWSF